MAASNSIANFVTSASLWPPRLVSEQSAWNGHIPFAGWVVEATRPKMLVELGTHTGVSYFAFCESVARLELDTTCFAVDTWLGDEQAGYYGEDVYRSVVELNNQYYESFSRLLRTTFDEAVERFEDGSIDLLHVDGLHTYEAVRHDFETWLPKLSGRALVLFHDTNERKQGFGVHTFFAELADHYPTFEFPHEHGLGVVCVGADQPAVIRDLVAEGDSAEGRRVQKLYRALGQRISAEVASSALAQRLESRDRELSRTVLEVEQRDQFIQQLKDERGVLDKLHQEEIVQRSRDAQADRDEATRLRSVLERLEQDAEQLRVEASLQRERADAIESSTSWRLTAPLRMVADWIKMLRRRVRQRSWVPESPAIGRLHETFDSGVDATTRQRLSAYYRSHGHLPQTEVSVILPTHNRADQVGAAIESVRDQTHQSWELFVVDDGSEDDTEGVVSHYRSDPRIRYVQLPRGGVSRARNAGLNLATGAVIAFLDSDNTWEPDYLQHMVAALDADDVEIAYSGMRLWQDGEVVGYRGDEFHYEECLASNYVDLNVLCHRRSIVDEGARFDETLRRMVDWDYLLGIARSRTVRYEPFIGANYSFHSSADQISVKEPQVYGRLVRDKHSLDTQVGRDSRRAYEEMQLTIAIGVAAPRDVRNVWGDYHFALGLAQAFERRGHTAGLVYFDEPMSEQTDVVISLRGLTGHELPEGAIRMLWSISHPDLLTPEEIDGFDLVFSASMTWPEAMRWAGTRTHTLPQATDRARFFPSSVSKRTDDVLFVGNSRGTDRPIVTDAIEAGLPLKVYGGGWRGRIPERYIAGDYLPNEQLSQWYGGSGGVLNDHWESMKDFGIVSNRVFDVTAAGGRLVSDHLPSLSAVFGDAVASVSSAEELRTWFEEADDTKHPDVAMWTLQHHSFDNRADSLLAHIQDFILGTTRYDQAIPAPPCPLCVVEPDLSRRSASTSATLDGTPYIAVRGGTRRLRIGVIPQAVGPAFTSSAYIRLVQPLTSEIENLRIELLSIRPADATTDASKALKDLDAVVVSRTAFADEAGASEWADACTERAIPLVLDTDDAFHLMDDSHSEYEAYRERLAAYAEIMGRATEVWCSTQALSASLQLAGVNDPVVVPNSIDPRLWRRYRSAAPVVRDPGFGLEVLYAGSMTHARDLELLLPILDALAGDVPFRLTVVGVAPDPASRPWIRRLSPGANALYPRYARWLRDLGSGFDVAVAPLVDTPFNRVKSDVKLLEYLAIGAVPLVTHIDGYVNSDVVQPGMLCAEPQVWLDRLRRFAEDGDILADAKEEAHQMRDLMWQRRRAATTGTVLAERIVALIGDVEG
jgi:glycosyltransferase involved in cell wall biosynthesis